LAGRFTAGEKVEMAPGQTIEGAVAQVKQIDARDRIEHGLRTVLFIFFCATLIFGPLALGVVQDWSIAFFESAAALILLLWSLWQLSRVELRPRWNPLFAPALVFAVLAVTQIALHRTVYLYDSVSEFWLYIAYGVLFFCGFQLFCASEKLVMTFAITMAAFGSLCSLFAVLQGFTSENKIYWWIKPRAGSVYGSYVNHNHYAGLMELLLPFVLVLASGRFARGAKRLLLGFSAILIAASVFLSGSRGGMFAILAETLFLLIVWVRQFSPKKSAAVFVAFCLITTLFLAWIAPAQVSGRITNFQDPARWLIHRDAIRMFAAHPIFGSGLGTFATAFPRYRVFYDGFVINHAHDDFLELLLDMGSAGFAVGILFFFVLYREGSRNVRFAKLSPSAAMATAALAGCTGLLVHSFVDFNLHIPANAALFYVMCALATTPFDRSASRFNKNKYSSSSYREKTGSPPNYSQ
jgi:O-antigen ligase